MVCQTVIWQTISHSKAHLSVLYRRVLAKSVDLDLAAERCFRSGCAMLALDTNPGISGENLNRIKQALCIFGILLFAFLSVNQI